MGGTDAGKDPDSRSIGSYQYDAFQGHKHIYDNAAPFQAGAWSAVSSGSAQIFGVPINHGITNVSYPTTDGASGTPRTAIETRPENIAVSYIIKY